jgi:hypothetical protein
MFDNKLKCVTDIAVLLKVRKWFWMSLQPAASRCRSFGAHSTLSSVSTRSVGSAGTGFAKLRPPGESLYFTQHYQPVFS